MKNEFNQIAFIRKSKNKQIEFMRNWFYERFEDPVHSTPYNSAEGGYLWIYGGPFDAEEILDSNFGALAKNKAIEELSEELADECLQWTRTRSYDDELFSSKEDYEFDLFFEDYQVIDRLESGLSSIEKLLGKRKLASAEKKFNEMMLFSFCITFLETYLSDIFLRVVLKNQALKKNYLKSDKELSVTKFSLGEIFEKHEMIDSIIKERVYKTSFHNISTVKALFHTVLGIDVGDISSLIKFVEKRHDFVHRGGRDHNDLNVITDEKEIRNLIKLVRKFCKNLDSNIINKKLIKTAPF